MAGREIELMSDRDQARQRLSIFAGMDIPSTVVRKEILDNEIDIVNERGQRANSCVLRIGPNRLQVMDNGSGISTSKKEGTGHTHLWLACAKMFSSSNYGGVSDTVGANGVGLTVSNYTSRRFLIALVNRENIQGYRFFDGFLCGTEECQKNVEENWGGGKFTAADQDWCSRPGDFIRKPLEKAQFVHETRAPYEIGFMVDIEWDPNGNIFPDRPDIDWLRNYVKVRAGELNSGEIILEVYNSDVFSDDSRVSTERFTKERGDSDYAKSWTERCQEAGATILKEGPWQIALSTDKEMHIQSVVQGAPVNSRYQYGFTINIQDYSVTVSVPISIRYLSADYPAYDDQTKTSVRYPYAVVNRAFQRSGDVYKYFYREAEKAYMAKVIKDSDSSMFWPALGEPSEAELLIAEGFSAISGLKAMRDPMTQACIALRGKFLNCWNLDMQKAMRSDVVKQILNAVIYTPYKRVILATDADDDGAHICGLNLALMGRFTNLIQEGKVYMVHTPHYLFKKRGKETLWSDDATDCPAGYHVTTLKGLGSMSPEEIEKFIMNPETRDLVQVTWDSHAEEALDLAFSRGGEDWIAS